MGLQLGHQKAAELGERVPASALTKAMPMGAKRGPLLVQCLVVQMENLSVGHLDEMTAGQMAGSSGQHLEFQMDIQLVALMVALWADQRGMQLARYLAALWADQRVHWLVDPMAAP